MSAIKLHLEDEERAAVQRLAQAMRVTPEDILYCALNRLMLAARDHQIRDDVVETRDGRRWSLPLWSDSARSVHAYEGGADDETEPSRYLF